MPSLKILRIDLDQGREARVGQSWRLVSLSVLAPPWAMCIGFGIAAALCAPDVQAQFYLGPEGDWTGLEGTKSSMALMLRMTQGPALSGYTDSLGLCWITR